MILEKQVVRMYRGMMYTRCDDNGTAFYFSAEDFPGLQREAFSFSSSRGHTLQGYLYRYAHAVSGRLILWEHGFGGGHRSYMKEIEMLCRHGFFVFAYDHTGCMESGGSTPNGLAQSLCDLNDCIEFLRGEERFRDWKISVVGHSWGGFSAMNSAALHPDITHIVALAGFVSVELLVNSFFSGLLRGYRRVILTLERESNPSFVSFSAVESLRRTDARVLLIYSDNDPMCRREVHYETLQRELNGRPNIETMLLHSRGHNPNYTEDAVTYLGEFSSARTKLLKKSPDDAAKAAFVQSWDWNRMTQQDPAVWDAIFRCLDS